MAEEDDNTFAIGNLMVQLEDRRNSGSDSDDLSAIQTSQLNLNIDSLEPTFFMNPEDENANGEQEISSTFRSIEEMNGQSYVHSHMKGSFDVHPSPSAAPPTPYVGFIQYPPIYQGTPSTVPCPYSSTQFHSVMHYGYPQQPLEIAPPHMQQIYMKKIFHPEMLSPNLTPQHLSQTLPVNLQSGLNSFDLRPSTSCAPPTPSENACRAQYKGVRLVSEELPNGLKRDDSGFIEESVPLCPEGRERYIPCSVKVAEQEHLGINSNFCPGIHDINNNGSQFSFPSHDPSMSESTSFNPVMEENINPHWRASGLLYNSLNVSSVKEKSLSLSEGSCTGEMPNAAYMNLMVKDENLKKIDSEIEPSGIYGERVRSDNFQKCNGIFQKNSPDDEFRNQLLNGTLRHRCKSSSTGELLSCVDCDYSSYNKSNFKNHLFIHSEERLFACPYCSYRGKQSAGLRAHLKVHSVEKPFKCSICNYRCKRKQNLIQHFRIHSKYRPFICSYCEYRSTTKQSLQKHMIEHFGDPSRIGNSKVRPKQKQILSKTSCPEENPGEAVRNSITKSCADEKLVISSQENDNSSSSGEYSGYRKNVSISTKVLNISNEFETSFQSFNFEQDGGNGNLHLSKTSTSESYSHKAEARQEVQTSISNCLTLLNPSETSSTANISKDIFTLQCPYCNFECQGINYLKFHIMNHCDEDLRTFQRRPIYHREEKCEMQNTSSENVLPSDENLKFRNSNTFELEAKPRNTKTASRKVKKTPASVTKTLKNIHGKNTNNKSFNSSRSCHQNKDGPSNIDGKGKKSMKWNPVIRKRIFKALSNLKSPKRKSISPKKWRNIKLKYKMKFKHWSSNLKTLQKTDKEFGSTNIPKKLKKLYSGEENNFKEFELPKIITDEYRGNTSNSQTKTVCEPPDRFMVHCSTPKTSFSSHYANQCQTTWSSDSRWAMPRDSVMENEHGDSSFGNVSKVNEQMKGIGSLVPQCLDNPLYSKSSNSSQFSDGASKEVPTYKLNDKETCDQIFKSSVTDCVISDNLVKKSDNALYDFKINNSVTKKEVTTRLDEPPLPFSNSNLKNNLIGNVLGKSLACSRSLRNTLVYSPSSYRSGGKNTVVTEGVKRMKFEDQFIKFATRDHVPKSLLSSSSNDQHSLNNVLQKLGNAQEKSDSSTIDSRQALNISNCKLFDNSYLKNTDEGGTRNIKDPKIIQNSKSEGLLVPNEKTMDGPQSNIIPLNSDFPEKSDHSNGFKKTGEISVAATPQEVEANLECHSGDQELTFHCSLCDSKFRRKSSLVNHRRSHAKDIFECNKCPFTFRYKKALEHHAKQHPSEETNIYSCSDCEFTTKRKCSLTSHSRIHQRKFKCMLCSFKCSFIKRMELHYMKHKREVRYERALDPSSGSVSSSTYSSTCPLGQDLQCEDEPKDDTEGCEEAKFQEKRSEGDFIATDPLYDPAIRSETSSLG